MYCPVNQSTCYWMQPSSYTYQQAQARCASFSGYIASWNEGPEQLQIENYFKVGACPENSTLVWYVCVLARLNMPCWWSPHEEADAGNSRHAGMRP